MVFKDLVDSAISQVRSQVPDNIHFNIDVPEDIRATLGPQRIERVLINLIVNAVHAMKDGGEITISARHEKAQDGFSFHVIDTGEGIDEKILAKIFNPFFSWNLL